MTGQYKEDELKRLQFEQLNILKEFIRICNKYDIKYFVNAGTIIGAVRHGGMIPWDDDIDVGMLREDYEKFLKVSSKELALKNEYRIIGPDCSEKYYNLIPMMVQNKSAFITYANAGNYKTGISMDIFPFDYVSSDESKRKKQIRRAQLWRWAYVIKNVNFLKVPSDGVICTVKHFIMFILHIFLNLTMSEEHIYKKYLKAVHMYPKERTYVTMLNDIVPEKFCCKRDDIFPAVMMKFEDIEVCVPKNYDEICTKVYGDYMTPPPEGKRKNHYPKKLDFGN